MSGFPVFVGCAGWSIPRQHASYFPSEGSHLERYARFLPAVEINSSFYRPHKPATYARWAASVPDGFRFLFKLPRAITHERRLRGADAYYVALAAELSLPLVSWDREQIDRAAPLVSAYSPE